MTADDLLDHGPNGSVVAVSSARDGPSGALSLGQLEFRGSSGTVRAEGSQLFREGRLSPDGRWFVTSTGYKTGLRTVLLDTATGRRVPLDLPDAMRGGRYRPVGMERRRRTDAGVVHEETQDGGLVEEVWACRPADGTCERVPDAVLFYPL